MMRGPAWQEAPAGGADTAAEAGLPPPHTGCRSPTAGTAHPPAQQTRCWAPAHEGHADGRTPVP